MSESPAPRTPAGPSAPEAGGEDHLPYYWVQLESVEEGIRRKTGVRAASLEEALVKVRDPEHWRPREGPGADPGRFRVVEVSEESATSEARHRRNARRRHLNTVVENGLTTLGKSVPDHEGDAFSDVLCDFFSRAVVWPGDIPFPWGNAAAEEAGRLLKPNDPASVMAQLLAAHLAHHGLRVAPAPEPPRPRSEPR
ncbi:hypothetical protein [Streptomyces sp. NPDC050560]|uniref:hypothetical protein n=1 Tax=Streptomyces sp. NPDC050560 TaxID=3365630 RepID=UPI00378CD8FF